MGFIGFARFVLGCLRRIAVHRRGEVLLTTLNVAVANEWAVGVLVAVAHERGIAVLIAVDRLADAGDAEEAFAAGLGVGTGWRGGIAAATGDQQWPGQGKRQGKES